MKPIHTPEIRSLVYATDVDVLGVDKRVDRRDGYWRIESPSNHTFWWGNLLLFDDPPGPGDGARWRELFAREFAGAADIAHQVCAWDRTTGDLGAAAGEFPAPFELELTAGLVASAEEIRPHPRANASVAVRALDPSAGGPDERLWDDVLRLQVEQLRTEEWARSVAEAQLSDYRERRNENLRELFRRGRGSWYVALLEDRVTASLGIVVTNGRARFQSVDTAAEHRGRGIATALVVGAARLAAQGGAVNQYVMAADPDYHAIRLYESVGFRRTETVCGVVLRPG